MARETSEYPGVSYVMPVLNEVDHIEAAVLSLTAQDYPGECEIVLALGPSVDGTNRVIEQLAEADPRIRSIPNELGSTPGGLNAAIRASHFPIVVRVDAHSVLPVDYTRIAVETLLRTGADNVGGIMKAEGVTAFERAVAHAYGARAGLGGTPHHVGGQEGPTDTAYLGTFQRHRLLEVGLFDEGIKRGQDWELNRRLRATGGTVWFTPELTVVYRPRSSVVKLVRQFVATGIWRGELARRFTRENGIRYFVPPVAVLGILLGIVLGVIGAVTASWLVWAFAVPAVYALFVLGAAVPVLRSEGPRSALWYLLVLPCIHFGWGAGFVLGFLKLSRNITAQIGR
ncbi:cellulose synthase/poly-beta-1,6-N-acetylglucosamine synthase-like glycosyltransferase [Homoserinimonas aerilata]|uniref:Cellulose synthase/poly-beta-1,6-N-acetylglucosamine synthase-like glycosyltransferase n=1 Tax=Homoserinimonas aerilata TaxID=1162970 RepID=A0A542YH66_9MICO|nr:glycosyltransferase family 2 protein [Homoserinimonas aerilata]TQL47443.1 cellulose synthase/poly-beta-1,6-N-acetylglucosamine synthase-like glycosyltransferase [Homoserinimonas aerilata]